MPTEISTPVSVAPDENVVIKKRSRVSAIHIARGSSIVFETQVAHIDSATGNDRVVNSGPTVTRVLSTSLGDKIGGTGATLGQTIAKLGEFYEKYHAEDIAAAVQNP